MSRARYRNDWFYLLSDDAHFEAEFEKLILQNAGLLRPEAIVVPFKELITAEGLPSRKADLALVDHRYRFWWIIEVELVGHSLQGHVLPQVRTFVEGRYGEPHVAALLREAPTLDPERLRAMMFGEQPDVVVISNRHNAQWEIALKNEGASFGVMNVYRSDTNRDIFTVEGTLPEPNSDCLTDIVPVRRVSSFYRVLAPGALPPCGPESKLTIRVEGKLTTFTLMETARDWFLFPDDVRLQAVPYSIFADDDGHLLLRERDA